MYYFLLVPPLPWYRPVRTDADDGVLAGDDHGAVDLVIAALQLVHQLRLGHVLRGLHGGGLLLNLGSDHIMLCTGRRMMTGLMGWAFSCLLFYRNCDNNLAIVNS